MPDTCALARSPHRPRAIDRADERQGFLRVLNPGLSLWLDEKWGSGHWLFSLKRFRRAKGSLGFFKAFRLSKDPPSFTTLFEDSVALLGILIAAAAIVASAALGHPELDGAGSIAIGLILAATSIFLARESKSLLIGEQAYPSIRESILAIANTQPTCLRANGLFTVQLGPRQIVAMLSLEFSDLMLAPQIEQPVNTLEKRVREENPEIVALFVKPQTAITFQDNLERSRY